MAIKDDDLLYVQRPTGLDSGKYKITAGELLAGGSSVTVSETAPTSPKEGDLWWADSDVDEGGGRLYVWTGDEWVDTSLPGGGSDDVWTEDSGALYPTTLTNNVGINTTTPARLLDVNGTSIFRGNLTVTEALSGGNASLKTNATYSSTNPVYSFYYNDNTGIGNPGENEVSLIVSNVEQIHVNDQGETTFNKVTEHAGGVSVTGSGISVTGGDVSRALFDITGIAGVDGGGNQHGLRVVGTYNNSSSNLTSYTSLPEITDVSYSAVGFSSGLINPESFTGTGKYTAGFRATKSHSNGAETNYGFVSYLDSEAGKHNYNFYAAGNAPNYFNGEVRSASKIIGLSGFYNAQSATNPTGGVFITRGTSGLAGLSIYGDHEGGAEATAQNFFKYNSDGDVAPTWVGKIAIGSSNIRIEGLAGGPLLRNGNDLDNSEGLINALKNALDEIDNLKSRIAALEGGTN